MKQFLGKLRASNFAQPPWSKSSGARLLARGLLVGLGFGLGVVAAAALAVTVGTVKLVASGA